MPRDQDPPTQQDDLGVIIIEEASLRESFTQIPNTILKRKDLSPGAKLTYVSLLSYAWQQGSCYPGQATLADDIGVGQRSVVRYMKELQDSGLLEVKRRGLGRTNLYTLTSWVKAKRGSLPDTTPATSGADNAIAQTVNSRSAQLGPLEVPGLADQQVPIWHREKYAVSKHTQSENTQSSNHFEGQTLHINNDDLHFREKQNLENLEIEDERIDHYLDRVIPPHNDGLTPVGEVVRTRRQRASQSASDGRGAAAPPAKESITSPSSRSPSGRSRTGGRRGLADQATPDIAAVMSQVSDELYDDAERSSLGRVVRLWQKSKASEGNFIAAIYAARKIAKQQGHIEKRASGEAGDYGLKNRMPYFLAVLADQLGLKPSP